MNGQLRDIRVVFKLRIARIVNLPVNAVLQLLPLGSPVVVQRGGCNDASEPVIKRKQMNPLKKSYRSRLPLPMT